MFFKKNPVDSTLCTHKKLEIINKVKLQETKSTLSIRKNRILRVKNLTKMVEDVYNENYQMFLKEVKK